LALPDSGRYFWKQGLLTVMAIMAINQIRLTVIACLPESYYFLHGPTGAFVLDFISLTVVGIMILSASKTALETKRAGG
jgi:hypothetical protein